MNNIRVNFIISSHVRLFALSFVHFATSNSPEKETNLGSKEQGGGGMGIGLLPMGIDIISPRA